MTGRGKPMTGRGVDGKGARSKTIEAEETIMYGESASMKKKRPRDKSAENSLNFFQASVADTIAEINVLFSKFADVMSERASVDSLQVRELEDLVKEVKELESHLLERKEQLRQSLAVVSDKLQG